MNEEKRKAWRDTQWIMHRASTSHLILVNTEWMFPSTVNPWSIRHFSRVRDCCRNEAVFSLTSNQHFSKRTFIIYSPLLLHAQLGSSNSNDWHDHHHRDDNDGTNSVTRHRNITHVCHAQHARASNAYHNGCTLDDNVIKKTSIFFSPSSFLHELTKCEKRD